MTPKQEAALREYLQESIVPLIEQVLVKKLGQAMSFAAEQLIQPKPAQQQEPMGATRLDGMRKAIYDLDCSLWRARVAAERNGEQHTQLGHAIDALGRLQTAFGIATPQPDTSGTRSWFTVDELNAWADKYNREHGIKGDA